MIPEREVFGNVGAKRHQQEPFVRGPLPLSWLLAAGRVGGRALHVGIILWFYRGMKGAAAFRLPSKMVRAIGLDRYAEYRALDALERAGLVAVTRKRGARPSVEIIIRESAER